MIFINGNDGTTHTLAILVEYFVSFGTLRSSATLFCDNWHDWRVLLK